MSKKRKVTVWLGDLHHTTIGRHSTFMPVALGYIASYTAKHVGEANVDFRFFTDSDKLFDALDDNVGPDVLALSNYVWNSELSLRVFRYSKERYPDVINVFGGPDIPQEESAWHTFLKSKPEVDLYVVREGEVPFALLVEKILAGQVMATLTNDPQPGLVYIRKSTGEFVRGPECKRLISLDDIPSPYLNGMMDQWFDGSFHPFLQAGRGCPYQCTFCSAGEGWYNKVYRFSRERLQQELEYIAQRIAKYPSMDLALCDSNFGQYKEDEETASIIRDIQKRHGWPNVVRSTTGKSQHERVFRVVETLQKKMEISLAAQSFNEQTLDAIKRKSLPLERFLELQKDATERGLRTSVDLIVPLPEETKETFFKGIEILANAGVQHVIPFTTMLLKDSALANSATRQAYSFETMYRLLPGQFGDYRGKKLFEIEEVCIATSTMTFEDYLDCRGIGFISVVFQDRQFDVVHKLLDEFNIKKFDFIHRVWEKASAGNTAISSIYEGYINASRNELFHSPEALAKYYSKDENYEALIERRSGDNLMRLYRSQIFIDRSVESIELALETLDELCGDKVEHGALDAVREWAVSLRDLRPLCEPEAHKEDAIKLVLEYDIDRWYHAENGLLAEFVGPVTYMLERDWETINPMLDLAKSMYGDNRYMYFPQLFLHRPISDVWRKVTSSKSSIGSIASIPDQLTSGRRDYVWRN